MLKSAGLRARRLCLLASVRVFGCPGEKGAQGPRARAAQPDRLATPGAVACPGRGARPAP
jgi:hypothetical protein